MGKTLRVMRCVMYARAIIEVGFQHGCRGFGLFSGCLYITRRSAAN
ncbi:hypothetical protein KRR23_20195 [Pseudomonas sp. CVAP|nr:MULTISPECIES: hypothetical protein [Pseudomonas]MBU6960052.1 hypothetical protein [Pseudomonas sp. CVAP\